MPGLRKNITGTSAARKLASLVACVLLAACSAPKEPLNATVWPAPKPMPMDALVDQHNQSFVGDGRWQLVFFGFTHCPDICPITLSVLAAAQRQLEENGQSAPTILLVTVDPERDNPDVLREYISNFDADIHAVTGELSDIEAVASAAGIFFSKSPQENGEYTVDHSSVVMLVDDQSRIRASFSAPHRLEQFVHDIPLLTNERW